MNNSRKFWRVLFFSILLAALCGSFVFPVTYMPVNAAPQMQVATQVVISQVYGGGGNTGATFTNDFIELFNRSETAVDITGWSIQYSPATDSVWSVTNLTSITLQPGQYYLIQEAAGSGGTDPLPPPDVSGSIGMSATAGKVALVNTTTPLSGTAPFGPNIIDLVGYGTTASFFEGSGPAPAPSASLADIRGINGCFDTDQNSVDFATDTPNPRNTVSVPVVTCSVQLTSTSAAITGTASAVNATGTAAFDQTATALASATVTTITTDTPDPSLVNQDVTVTVTVTGSTVPTGTVAITGADVNCTITLSNGAGSCLARFTSIGSKTITATYSGDSSHTTSSDTEAHQVSDPATGSATSVVISEFRTRGAGGASDEFIELYNPTSNWVDISGWKINASNNSGLESVRATIPASTIIRSGQYYLVANNSYNNPTAPADLRYGTAISDDGGIALIRPDNTISDEVGMNAGSAYQEGTVLAPLTTASDQSYERDLGGASDSCQDTANNSNDFDQIPSDPRNSSLALRLCGVTPSISTPQTTTTVITADTPDPSAVNGNVTVSVRVTGGSLTPSGKVNITGANTNCTINALSASGTGSCTVKFTSSGTKTLTATYLGDNTHAKSIDTESHVVGTSTVPTVTRVPTLSPPVPLVAINEFVPRPGHDWNNDGEVNVLDEYIEILNHGTIDVNLSGYSLDDEANIGSTPYRLPSVVLKPGERIVFYGSQTGLLLSDGGDGVRLLKPNGQLMDAYNYTVARYPDQSYCRLPDNGGLDDWNQNCYPTPGLQNSLSGEFVSPGNGGNEVLLCPIADTLPEDFVFAECSPYGNNIWRRAFWDAHGWYGEKILPGIKSRWDVFAD